MTDPFVLRQSFSNLALYVWKGKNWSQSLYLQNLCPKFVRSCSAAVPRSSRCGRAKYSSCYFPYCTCDQCFKHKDGTRVVFGRLRSLDTKGLVFGWGKGVSALTGLSKGLFHSRYWKHTSLSCSAEDTYNRATVPASGLHYSHDIILEKEVLDLKVSLGEAGLRLATDGTA